MIIQDAAEHINDELTQPQQARALQAASDLAKRGYENHIEAIELAKNMHEEIIDVVESIPNIGVTVRDESDNMGKDAFCHAVAITEFDADKNVIAHHHDIAVTTKLERTDQGICYRTKAQTLIEDMLVHVLEEKVIGAVIT